MASSCNAQPPRRSGIPFGTWRKRKRRSRKARRSDSESRSQVLPFHPATVVPAIWIGCFRPFTILVCAFAALIVAIPPVFVTAARLNRATVKDNRGTLWPIQHASTFPCQSLSDSCSSVYTDNYCLARTIRRSPKSPSPKHVLATDHLACASIRSIRLRRVRLSSIRSPIATWEAAASRCTSSMSLSSDCRYFSSRRVPSTSRRLRYKSRWVNTKATTVATTGAPALIILLAAYP